MPKLISLVSDVLNFEAGAFYYGEEDGAGWRIFSEYPPTAGAVVLSIPANMVHQTKPTPEAAVAVAAAAVGSTFGADEQAALEAFRNSQSSGQTPAAPGAPVAVDKKSIVSQILGEEMKAAGVAGDGTPEDLRRLEEIMRMRKRLAPHPPKLQVGQFFLTDVTEGRPPKSGVDHVISTYPLDHFPEALRRDIPEVNPFHVWDPDVLEAIHMSHKLNVKNLLTGFPGSGKSTSIKEYAALIGQPFMKINGKSGIDGSAFIGFLWASNGGTEYAEGLLPVAMRNGYLLCVDEVFKIPPEIQMNFQTVYEEGGTLLLDEKPGLLADKLVQPHPDFRLMATDNCLGTGDNFEKFGATQVQDTSTLDRFGITVMVPYMEQKIETATLFRMYPTAHEDSINRLVKAAGLIREAYRVSNVSLTLSMRGLKVMARLLSQGVSEYAAFVMVYLSKLADDAEINTAKAFVDTVGLSKDAFAATDQEPDALEPSLWVQVPWVAPAVEEEKKPKKSKMKPLAVPPWEQQ